MHPSSSGVILFCAKPVGVLALETLIAEKTPVVGVVTVEGEGMESLRTLALQAGATFFGDVSLKDEASVEKLFARHPFVGLSVSYPKKVPLGVIERFPGKIYNVHPAKLPQYRGCFPTVWPILNGDETADLTLHVMEEGFDTGPVVDRVSTPIDPCDTGWSVYQRLVDALPELFHRNLDAMLAGDVHAEPQDDAMAAYYPNQLPHAGWLDWNWPGEQIVRFVRALYHPIFTGAQGVLGEGTVEILEAEYINQTSERGTAGSILDKSNGITVSCGDGKILIKTIRTQSEVVSLINAN